MISTRQQLLEWFETGAIAPGNIRSALTISKVLPDGRRWLAFIDTLLLVLGVISLVCAVIFFIAYNWDALGRFTQFALVQLLMVGAILTYWRLGTEQLTAKIALLAAGLLLGALLAFYGQTYQTGADTWQLFATWSVLMLPWVFISRFPPLWLLLIALLNLTLILYFQNFRGLLRLAFGSRDELTWWLLALNSVAWVTWELAARNWVWLAQRWSVRLIAVVVGTAITMLALRGIFDPSSTVALSFLVYIAWLVLLYHVYRRKLPDLFMLAGGCLSLIICLTAALTQVMLKGNDWAGSLLFLAVLVVAQAAAAAIWLRRIQAEQSK